MGNYRCDHINYDRSGDRIMEDINLADQLPIGSILPFKPGEVPSNWREFNGDTLTLQEYPTVVAHLFCASKDTTRLWERMGGSIKDNKIILPRITSDAEANQLVWGNSYVGLKAIPMKVAIKVSSNG